MTNSPALIVRHRRFTLLIGLLLCCMLAVAATAISIELYRLQTDIMLVLSPQLLVLVAACMAKGVAGRWAASAPTMTVSAEGLTLPGQVLRPIPWTAVRSARGICCSPAARQATVPRHYVAFDVEAPESFGVTRKGILRRTLSPLPPAAPLITIDISEFDTGTEAILAAVRRFHPAAVAEAAPDATLAARVHEASISVPSLQQIMLGARAAQWAAHRQAITLLQRRGELWPATASTVRARVLQASGVATVGLALAVQARAWAHKEMQRLRMQADMKIAHAFAAVRTATHGVRQHLGGRA